MRGKDEGVEKRLRTRYILVAGMWTPDMFATLQMLLQVLCTVKMSYMAPAT